MRYLANRDDNLHFALLTDLADSTQEIQPEDEELVRLAREGIERLNQKYETIGPTFSISSTVRAAGMLRKECGWVTSASAANSWSSVPSCAARANRFAEIVGDTTVLPQVRYVITLDTDTQLPRDSAREMVGAMAHPLNRPVFDPERRRVVTGYGILQPRVGVSLPSSRRSWFVRLFAGDAGVDPYTRVVSDLYQDLFGEGSFVGKGIYDVDAFLLCCGLPRQCDPEPRPAGKRPRPVGTLERCGTLRGIPVALPGRRQPAAPLDARRLADRLVAACRGSRR